MWLPSIMRSPMSLCGTALIVGAFLYLGGCSEGASITIDFYYTCSNGEAALGTPDDLQYIEQCAGCDEGYYLHNDVCVANVYTCADGIAQRSGAPGAAHGAVFCAQCNDGFTLDDEGCRQIVYTCANGVVADIELVGNSDMELCLACYIGYFLVDGVCESPMSTCANGTPTTDGTLREPGTEHCAACDVGYGLVDNTCRPDSDGDDVPDSIDIDDDNDGLIDIHTLDMLYNISYNLRGTTYVDEDDGEEHIGDTTGAPIAPTDDCAVATDGVYLCGYELTQDLDFADASDYESGEIMSAWRPHGVSPDESSNEGWPGLGHKRDGGLQAVLDGNGYTIANLYMRADSQPAGFVHTVADSGHIRNVDIVNGIFYGENNDTMGILVGENNGEITGSSAGGAIEGADRSKSIGGLVGLNNGIIVASAAHARVTGGNSIDIIGGLVGTNAGTVVASYATSVVAGGGSGDVIGGLIGHNATGAKGVIGSYATGNVDGNSGNDRAGGLVGESVGYIVASYATGNVLSTDDTTTNRDVVGGLVGTTSGIVIASYATGIIYGGAGDDHVGGLAGMRNEHALIIASYGFGNVIVDDGDVVFHEDRPTQYFTTTASSLQIDDPNKKTTYAGDVWNSGGAGTHNAWDMGSTLHIPAVRYADYDGGGSVSCDIFPAWVVCGETLLPNQRE